MEIFFDLKPNVTSSFHASQFAANLAEQMLEDAGSKEGAPVLSASQAIEDFALEYAEQHLNDSEPITIIKEKLGKLLYLVAAGWTLENNFYIIGHRLSVNQTFVINTTVGPTP